MRNFSILQNRQSNLVLCPQCGFFPNNSDIEQQTLDRSLYFLKWQCLCCNSINTCPSDQYFRVYHANTHVLVNEQILYNSSQYCVLDISGSMEQQVPLIRSHNMKYHVWNRQQMCLQSPMLRAFLEIQASEQRRRHQMNFSWAVFLRKRTMTKFEYCLWAADMLRERIGCMRLLFADFSQLAGNDEFMIGFVSKIKSLNINIEIVNLDELKNLLIADNFRSLISFTSYSLEQLLKLYCKPASKVKAIAINLQDEIDPVTLLPTSTGYFLQALRSQAYSSSYLNNQLEGKSNIMILDRRIQRCKQQKQFVETIAQKVISAQNQFYFYEGKQGQSSAQWVRKDKINLAHYCISKAAQIKTISGLELQLLKKFESFAKNCHILDLKNNLKEFLQSIYPLCHGFRSPNRILITMRQSAEDRQVQYSVLVNMWHVNREEIISYEDGSIKGEVQELMKSNMKVYDLENESTEENQYLHQDEICFDFKDRVKQKAATVFPLPEKHLSNQYQYL